MRTTIALLCLCAGIGSAKASTYQFTLTGFDSASFTISSNPVPLVTDSVSFVTSDVSGQFSSPNNLSSTAAKLKVFTVGGSGGGGFSALFPNATNFNDISSVIFDAPGPQLFSGSLSNPTFLLGTYALINAFTAASDTLVISVANPSPVPEPPSWAMALFGVVAAGWAIRYRGRSGA